MTDTLPDAATRALVGQTDLAPIGSHRAGGMHTSYTAAHIEPKRRRYYLSTTAKFWLAFAFATAWMGVSIYISLPWIHTLASHISLVPAIITVTLLAFVPGHLVSFMAAAVLLDRQPKLTTMRPTTPLTVLVAARNEVDAIGGTIEYLARQDYDGPLHVVLIDNGSTDGTSERAREVADQTGLDLTVLLETTPGKSHALNRGLEFATTPLIVTVDADTLLHKSALRVLVARLESAPPDVLAVAGNVQVRNSREGVWARLQSCDYLLGIAAVKRVQGMFQGTLVAQGAFSLYRTEPVREVNGWPDAIGEDIVLTWELIRRGRVFYEPLALAFTSAPATFRSLGRQRSRWARGMIEGIRSVPPWRQRRFIPLALTAVDLVIPLLDLAYVFLWIPGLALALTGRFWIVGPVTIAVMPLTLVLYATLYRFQNRGVLRPLGLVPRRDKRSMVLFLIAYQALMSGMSVIGYGQEVFRLRRSWK